MIKDLLNVLKKDSLMDQAYEKTYEMIDITFEMYKEIQNRLRDDAKYKFSFDIRDQDIAINKYEREVRRNVLTHLSESDSWKRVHYCACNICQVGVDSFEVS